MERFATIIQHRSVFLNNVVDVARFSYSSRDSIAYLNLNLCEYSAGNNNSRPYFISSIEKCQKIFSQSRSLLYNLHLDFAKGRECNFKYETPIGLSFDRSIQHIGQMQIYCRLYTEIMSDLVEEALNVVNPKLKLLRLLLKRPLLKDEILFYLEPRIVNNLIDCFYPDVTDPALFRGFFANFNLHNWIIQCAQPEMLEYLLRQSCLYARAFEYPFYDLIDDCVWYRSYSNIGPILKRASAPKFNMNSWHITLISIIRPDLTEEMFEEALGWTTPERICMILQIIWMFYHSTGRHCIGVGEALRLIWSSISDACITFEELEKVFDERFTDLPDEELRNMYNFYCRIIGEIHLCIEPRSLKHLCRTIVRRMLSENGVWIPDGICLTDLPTSLQAFINLE